MNKGIRLLSRIGTVPVTAMDGAEKAVNALAMRRIVREMPDRMVGAGRIGR